MRCSKYLLSWLWGSLVVLTLVAQGATLNVTDYGAVGDCKEVTVSVISNSPVVTTTNTFSAADVGKVMCLFGAGFKSTLSSTGIFRGNYRGTPTNNQDMVVRVLSVADGTNVTLSSVCGITAGNIRCTYGTQNKAAFDNCIAAAQSNDVVRIPSGNYLLIPPTALDTNWVQKDQFDCGPTITFKKGALHFLGDGTNATILTGNGAWQQKGYDAANRGYLFRLEGPVTNNGPLIFDSIQFNGNATRKHTGYFGWPAVPTDGSGWDVTHHAVTDSCSPAALIYQSYTNCLFTRWHGETLQGIPNGEEGFVDVGNCWFVDGNSTVWNSPLSHDYHHNVVMDYYQAEESWQGASGGTSYFRFNYLTNIYGSTAIAITGSDTNYLTKAYNIQSNVFYTRAYSISTTPGINLNIVSNYFNSGAIALGCAGYQGSAFNSNIFIGFNVFTNSQIAVGVFGSGRNRSEAVFVVSNYATVTLAFGEAGEQAGSWSTNVVFRNNVANKGLWSTWATGQYLIDDISNSFPSYRNTDLASQNPVSYARGARHSLNASRAGAKFYLDTSNPLQLPGGATLVVTNAGLAATLYTSMSLVDPISTTNGYAGKFVWTNGVWQAVFGVVTGLRVVPLGNP